MLFATHMPSPGMPDLSQCSGSTNSFASEDDSVDLFSRWSSILLRSCRNKQITKESNFTRNHSFMRKPFDSKYRNWSRWWAKEIRSRKMLEIGKNVNILSSRFIIIRNNFALIQDNLGKRVRANKPRLRNYRADGTWPVSPAIICVNIETRSIRGRPAWFRYHIYRHECIFGINGFVSLTS